MERLDKFIAARLNLPRSEAKALLKQKRVTLNGAPVTAGDLKCAESDTVRVDGTPLSAERFVYLMMNKPKGVVSATEDKSETTVLDILPDELKRKGLFPAGRLDKDTTGFLLLTNDGAFAHRILSPKKHIPKTYRAVLDKPITDAVCADFEQGMTLGEEQLLPAVLTAVNDAGTEVNVTIHQGIFHQIKRMFAKHGITVVELERITMGQLELDAALARGEVRQLSAEEVAQITE